MKLREIIQETERLAPPELAEEWDNIGLMVGHPEDEIHKVLVAMDASPDVVSRAVREGYDLILTHHPLIFKPLKNLDFTLPKPQLLRSLIKSDIAVYSAHTNLDRVDGGVNAALAERLGLSFEETLSDKYGFIAQVSPIPLKDFAFKVKTALNLQFVRVAGPLEKTICKVAVMGGGGGGDIQAAIDAGCDVYVTADLRSHQAADAVAAGMALIDGTHYATEAPVLPVLQARLSASFPSLQIDIAAEVCPFVIQM